MSEVGGHGRGRPVPPPRQRPAPEVARSPSSALALRPPAALQLYDPRRHRAPLVHPQHHQQHQLHQQHQQHQQQHQQYQQQQQQQQQQHQQYQHHQHHQQHQQPARHQFQPQAVPAPIPAPAAPAAPRTLVLHRPDAHRGFGFTLRHLVVYPPDNLNELYDDGRHLAVGVLGAPMDTIFVRSVRERGAAAAAGLRAGDRVVAVNGEPVLCGGRAPYARVVQLAQREPHRLTLTVVPRDADVLQRYFSEAAYNPETNQRPQQAGAMAAARRERAAECAGAAPDSRRDSAASSDDALILSRIRKSLEQKEAFLRRPSQPTGWLDAPPALLQREFYARPQKLQKPMWPPNANGHQIKSIDQRRQERASITADDYDNQRSELKANQQKEEDYASVGGSLCHIQELPVSSLNSRSSLNGSLSGAEDMAPSSISSQESKYLVPADLAIVTSRRRQLAAARETARDRTALYRSELARLSTTRPEPTVALRRREFETRGATRRDARSLDAHNSHDEADMDSLLAAGLSGNCLTITGSKHLHCPPPSGFTAVADSEKVQMRARSNSIGNETLPTRRHQTSDGSHMKRRLGLDSEQLEALNRTSLQEPKGESSNSSNCDINQVPNDYKEVYASNKSVTSDDYAGNGRIPRIVENDRISDEDFGGKNTSPRIPEKNTSREPVKKLERPNQLSLAPPAEVFGACSPSTTPTTPTSPAGFVDDTVTRRQKNAAQMGAEEERAMRRVSYLKATWGDRLHLDSDPELSDGEPHSTRSVEKKGEGATITEEVDHGDPADKGIIVQGNVQVKMVLINGKRASDRSWKQVWAVLHGPKLYLYRHHSNQSPSAAAGPASGSRESLDVRYSLADMAGDYTKRKHVLRVTCAAGAELLLQADGAGDAQRWLRALRCQAATPERAEDEQTPSGADDAEWPGAPRGLSPLPPQRTKKISRNRSPSGPPTPTLPSSPKTKTWKGRMARQLRRMQGGGGAAPAGLLGAPLERCPAGADLPGVPLAVRACAAAVEARGLRTVGLYRVPGNAAGVAALAAALDRAEPPPAADPRWADVHVVSSLLKAFFRKLPDSLLTAELYPALMAADRARGAERARGLRRLVRALPAAHYETLAFVVRHLRRVAAESHVNKMEARNLAIVFGPTLVRGADDDMLTMVNDMSSQCRIIESLINHYEWYFDEEERGSPVSDPPGDEELAATTSNQALLIDNVKKIEGKEVTTRDIVSSIISAANRKIQRKPRSKPSVSSSSNLDNVSKKSSDSQDKSPVDSQQLELASSDETLGSGSGEALASASRENCSSPTFQPYHYTQSLADYDGLPIKTYSGLNQTTQERIKKFEMETKAMLQRDKRRDVASLVDWSASAIANLKNGQMNRDASSKSEAANIVSKEIAASAASEKRIKNNTSSLSSFSIEGTGDLVSSLTSTFDQKLRTLNSSSLLNDGTIPYVDDCQEDTHSEEPAPNDSVKGKSIPEKKYFRKESTDKIGDSDQQSKSKFPPVHLNKIEVKCQNKDEDESNYDSEKENYTKTSPLVLMTTEFKSIKPNLPEKKYENTLDYEKDIDTASQSENEKGDLDNDVCNEKKILNNQNAPKNTLRNNTETGKRNSAVLESGNDLKLGGLKSASPNSFGIKLKRSESLNRETGRDNAVPNNKVLRSESLNYKVDKVSPTRTKLQRSESLNKPEYSFLPGGDLVKRADSLNKSDGKLKFSDCLSKNEKTESNILKQRELNNGLYRSTKLKRKNGMPERSIKRRHTVGGTKDFDKDGWIDRHSRTSSPDLTHMSLIAPLAPLILPLESHV